MLLLTGCFRKDRVLSEITMNTDKTIYIRQKKKPNANSTVYFYILSKEKT